MSNRTLLCFALQWGHSNHTSAAFREAAETGIPHVKPHPALFRSALGALQPYFGRFPRGCRNRITACQTAPCFVSLCIGGIATILQPLSERLPKRIIGVTKSDTLPIYRLAAHFATTLSAVWNLMNLHYMFCGMICHVYVPRVN
jgi:hypothetical protein